MGESTAFTYVVADPHLKFSSAQLIFGKENYLTNKFYIIFTR